ncbi:glycosyltransferase family 39 protein [Rhabdochromatium marinum]|uniref:glycosyltransferase family 39 protein n=1 Tax=Rhabdochromatium marinum TaxID=48729 RepID=UPI0019043875|nr:glycosyltransferase family 39 protein [Rhabdochromatium marinum]MBK1647057.1 hypothetical protein [Rhabdochromatium marinum]
MSTGQAPALDTEPPSAPASLSSQATGPQAARSPYNYRPQHQRIAFWLLTTLIALLSLWRLYDLPHLLIWHDEVFTLVRVLGFSQPDIQQMLFSAQLLSPEQLLALQHGPAAPLGATWVALIRHPEHAPLYYLIARLALALPLDPVTAVRGVAALFALFLPAAAFWLMQELFGQATHSRPAQPWKQPLTWPVPWMAALLIAASPLHLLYAQEARQYGLWTLLSIASSAAFLRAWRTDQLRVWIGYGVLITLGLYAHLLFLLMLPVHALYALITSGPPWRWRLVFDQRMRRLTATLGLALLLFSPWLLVIALQTEQLEQYTQWMERPLSTAALGSAWLRHITRFFVDLSPEFSGWGAWVLMPVIWGLGLFAHRAPRPSFWMLPLLTLAYFAVVLGPDLLLGGSRSEHPRYVLPAAVAVQLMVAWGLATTASGPPGLQRTLAHLSLVMLVIAGLLSEVLIQRADSWWTKNFSAANQRIAETVNASPRALVVASPHGVSTGELLSLAYHLAPGVRLWSEPPQGAAPLGSGTPNAIPDGFVDYFALTPSASLRQALAPRRLEPLEGSWQWFRARPPNSHE